MSVEIEHYRQKMTIRDWINCAVNLEHAENFTELLNDLITRAEKELEDEHLSWRVRAEKAEEKLSNCLTLLQNLASGTETSCEWCNTYYGYPHSDQCAIAQVLKGTPYQTVLSRNEQPFESAVAVDTIPPLAESTEVSK